MAFRPGRCAQKYGCQPEIPSGGTLQWVSPNIFPGPHPLVLVRPKKSDVFPEGHFQGHEFSAERWRGWGTQGGVTTGCGTCAAMFRCPHWRPARNPGVCMHARAHSLSIQDPISRQDPISQISECMHGHESIVPFSSSSSRNGSSSSSSSSKGNYRLTLLYLSEDESIGSWLLIEFCQELSPATNRGDKISRRRRRRPLH
jgi:hypothetical protein